MEWGRVKYFANRKARKAPNPVLRSLNDDGHYFNYDEVGDWKLASMSNEAMFNMIKKWDKVQASPPIEDVPIILSYMELINFGIFSKVKPYSISEVMEEVVPSKSPGFPWTNLGYAHKGDCLNDPWWNDWLRKHWYDKYPFIWCLFPKEELRPGEKVKLNKTRAIMNAPLDFLIKYGTFIYPILNQLLDNPLVGPSTLGICPYYGGWNCLAKKLKIHFFGFEADIESNDMSQNYLIMLIAHLYIRQFLALTDEEGEYFDYLFRCSVFKFVVTVDGYLVFVPFGRATGEVNTAMGNTLVCMILLFWIMSYLIERYRNISHKSRDCVRYFMANFSVAVNGDDNNFTLSNDAQEWFKVSDFNEIAARLGFSFSFSSSIPLVPTSLRFLGMGFQYDIDKYIPVPDLSKVLASIFNSGKIRELREPWICVQRLCALRILLYPYPGYFESCTELLKRYIAKYEPIYAGTTAWQDAKHSYFTNYEIKVLYHGLEGKTGVVKYVASLIPPKLDLLKCR